MSYVCHIALALYTADLEIFVVEKLWLSQPQEFYIQDTFYSK